MANGYLINQTIITKDNLGQSKNIFSNKQVIKVGVSGYPGSTFIINSIDENNCITLNKYGIYELDVSDVGYLTSFIVNSLASYVDEEGVSITPPMYIDYVYYNTQTEGGSVL